METIHCKLVAKKEGLYTLFVFQADNGNFYMCTKLPNWGPFPININDTGFLTFEIAEAGQKYYDRFSDSYKTYQFSNSYFKDFIKDNEQINKITL